MYKKVYEVWQNINKYYDHDVNQMCAANEERIPVLLYMLMNRSGALLISTESSPWKHIKGALTRIALNKCDLEAWWFRVFCVFFTEIFVQQHRILNF